MWPLRRGTLTPAFHPFMFTAGDREVYVITLKIKYDGIGKIASILKWLEDKGLEILHVVRGMVEHKNKVVTYFIVVNASTAAMSIEALKEELAKNEAVISLSVGGERAGPYFLYPDAFPYYTNERSFLTTMTFFRSFLKSFYSLYKGTLGASVLMRIGMLMGRDVAEKYYNTLGLHGIGLVETIFHMLKAMGWGEFEKPKVTPKKIVVRVKNNFEAFAAPEMSGPRCHLTKGFLSGLFSRALGKEIVFKETKCEGEGARYCEFVGEEAK